MNEEFGVLKGMIPACTGVEMHKLAILQVRIPLNPIETIKIEIKGSLFFFFFLLFCFLFFPTNSLTTMHFRQASSI